MTIEEVPLRRRETGKNTRSAGDLTSPSVLGAPSARTIDPPAVPGNISPARPPVRGPIAGRNFSLHRTPGGKPAAPQRSTRIRTARHPGIQRERLLRRFRRICEGGRRRCSYPDQRRKPGSGRSSTPGAADNLVSQHTVVERSS